MSLVSAPTSSRSPKLSQASNVATGVLASGNTTLLTVDVRGLSQLFVSVLVATQALDAFIVSGRAIGAADFVSMYTAITSTPGGLIVAASGTLASLSGAQGWFVMNVRGLDAVQIAVSAGSDGADVTLYASAA